MSRSLVHRYHYGNSGWPNPFSPEAELIYKSPIRQMEMIHLARQQIDSQNNASREIVKSNLIGAKIVANEIEQQTQTLDRTINQISDRISGSITLAADQISDAIDLIGDRICVELSEIKWQLIQQTETLEKILEALNKSRNIEAKQLVKQGLRHYVNDEFEEAEERFKLALKFDTTDYQVLMNLAFIELHKENASQAFIYFNKALSLPEGLDSISKARTLWATARLYYAENDFNNAYAYAEEAFKYDNQNDSKILYTVGVYAALSEKNSVALEKIERSIIINPSYISKCLVDPDLNFIKDDILQIIGRLSANAESIAKQKTEQIYHEFSILEVQVVSYGKDNFTERIKNIINNAIGKLKKPSYSFCLLCANNMDMLQRVFPQIETLIPLYSDLQRLQTVHDDINEIYLSGKPYSEPKMDLSGEVIIIMLILSIILPIFFGLKGLAAVGIMWVLKPIIRKLMEINYDNEKRKINRIVDQVNKAYQALNKIQDELTSKQKAISEQLQVLDGLNQNSG